MTSVLVVQGRQLRGADINLIRGLLDEHHQVVSLATQRGTVPALGLAQRARPVERHRRAHTAAETGTWRLYPATRTAWPFPQRTAQPAGGAGAPAERTHSRPAARPAAAARGRRRAEFGRRAPVQRPARPRALPRTPQHGRRKPPLPCAGPTWPRGALRPVRLGGVEMRRPRCLHRLGPPHARTQPATPDQQHPLSHSRLGPGSASGQSCAGFDRSAHPRRLASQVWASRRGVGNVRGPFAVQGNVLPSRQRAAAGPDHGPHPQRPDAPHSRRRQGRVPVSARGRLPTGAVHV